MMNTDTVVSIPICRIAIVGAQRQRVAKVIAVIHSDESLSIVDTLSISGLLSLDDTSSPTTLPTQVRIEYLPCVATFDSYENEHDGAEVRYLSKLEHHGPNGTFLNGKTMAPFFENRGESNHKNDEIQNLFPGITAVAIGCGIDSDEDVTKVKTFLQAISSSCTSEVANVGNNETSILIECIRPNKEFSSMKEENESFRDMSDEMKKEAVKKRKIGPGKMASFAYTVAQKAVKQRWQKVLTGVTPEENDEKYVDRNDGDKVVPELAEITPAPHVIDLEKTRYACKRCRSVLFGTDDLENPPHVQSLHNFRRKGQTPGHGMCQNLFIAQPLSWMYGCGEMEGKLHCPKCQTKVGHYAWTGAQCSCGTWVTPAILVPVSKVDEMKPASQNSILTREGSFLFDRPNVL